MPFLPTVVNLLLYFAGYSPLERNEIFSALSQDAQRKFITKDTEFANYAFPRGQCPNRFETLAFTTNQLGDNCCNPIFHGLCDHHCFVHTESHRRFVVAMENGVRNAFQNCEHGLGVGDSLLFLYVEPYSTVLQLMLESAGSTPCFRRNTKHVIGLLELHHSVEKARPLRFLDLEYPWSSAVNDLLYTDMKVWKDAFVQNMREGAFPETIKCREHDRSIGKGNQTASLQQRPIFLIPPRLTYAHDPCTVWRESSPDWIRIKTVPSEQNTVNTKAMYIAGK